MTEPLIIAHPAIEAFTVNFRDYSEVRIECQVMHIGASFASFWRRSSGHGSSEEIFVTAVSLEGVANILPVYRAGSVAERTAQPTDDDNGD